MPPVITVVGRSGSGKTHLLERLVPELVRRGYRVGVVKHSAHGFDLDREGTDSQRLVKAGSAVVGLVSPTQFALLQHPARQLRLEEILRLLIPSEGELDLVLVEGFSREKAIKIETHRRELGEDLLCDPSGLWAVVSDSPLDLSIPRFSWGDIAGLAGLIATTFPIAGPPRLELYVNGVPVHTNPFVVEIMSRTLQAMVSTLRGVDEVRQLDIRVNWRGQGLAPGA